VGQGGQDDPDVAVDVLLAGGTRAGMVMDARTLDVGAVTRRGRVVDTHQQALGIEQRADRSLDGEGQVVGRAADGADRDVALAVVVVEAAGAEPGGDGAAAAREQNAAQEQGQAPGGAAIEPAGQSGEGAGQQRGQVRQ
jgi:hypothetical protein